MTLRRDRSLVGSRLRVAWADHAGSPCRIEAVLDATWLTDPNAQSSDDTGRALLAQTRREIERWAAENGRSLSVSSEGGQLRVEHIPGLLEAFRPVPDLAAVIEDARRSAADRLAMRYEPDGSAQRRYAPLVHTHAPRLAPLAHALLGTVPSGRLEGYLARALSFVQSIPYRAGSGAFMLPAGILARDHGDCDEKCVLLAGLLKAAFPSERCIVVLIEGHALMGLPVVTGSKQISSHGVRWTLCEPAGPALTPLGAVGPDSLEALRARAREIELIP